MTPAVVDTTAAKAIVPLASAAPRTTTTATDATAGTTDAAVTAVTALSTITLQTLVEIDAASVVKEIHKVLLLE